MGYVDVDFPRFIVNQEDPIILDIGSYNGDDAVRFKLRFPSAKVFAIEAARGNLDKFQHAIDMGVNVRHLAIGETCGEIQFHASVGDGLDGSGSILSPSSKMKESHPLLNFSSETVQCLTIPAFCQMENLERIDCIHMDIQGAEIGVIKSMGDYRPDCIYTETCEYDIYENSGSLQEMDNLMHSIGYRVEGRHYGHDGKTIWDTFYVREDLFPKD